MLGAGWIFISKENECYHIFSNSMEQRNIIGGACSLKKVPSMTHPIVYAAAIVCVQVPKYQMTLY